MKVHPEPLGDDALEVDPVPAHNAVLLTIRTGLGGPGELGKLLREAGFRAIDPVSISPSGPDALKRWTQSRSV
jgi:hypothetical protein